MGNTRRARPGRQQQRLSQKQQIKLLERELAYVNGFAQSVQAQLNATRMERPADLDEWIDSVALPDMDEQERAAWDAMSEAEREQFKDELGRQINAAQLLTEIGVTPGTTESPKATTAT